MWPVDLYVELTFRYTLNVIAERFRFRKGQEPSDDIDDYIATLRGLASTCNFGERADKKIRGQLVEKTLRRNFVNVYCWKAQVKTILLARQVE